jgi:hypothetical protein
MSWSDIEGNKEPKFMKLYIEDLGKLKQLTGTQRVVLDVLMKYSRYSNDIIITKSVKRQMLDYCEVSNGVFKNSLSTLVKKDIIRKGNVRSTYIINPDLAFKGKVNDKARVIIEYNELGRNVRLESSNEV